MKKIQIVVTQYSEETGEVQTHRLPVHDISGSVADYLLVDLEAYVIDIICQHFSLDAFQWSESHEQVHEYRDGTAAMFSYLNTCSLSEMTQVMVVEVSK